MDTPQQPRRTPEQVAAAAAAMDRALAAGLPPDVLGTMLSARAAWWGHADWPAHDDLARVLAHPASRAVDELLWQAIRRRIR
ncbi:hypothetical protein [Cellulomonas sp. C5510]|uniref:hypothetical protein n=1 Tax=Cellulomonas sp. C5510 TaxID=2871170 RepID=UPI001C949FF6|nr:hypothetical protein [Cellulomonas sp. C5510]QZN86864.1 hypothetical protein K5O09_07075 [Cellulomonas sp. C5510]